MPCDEDKKEPNFSADSASRCPEPRLPRSLFEIAKLQQDRRKAERSKADRRQSVRAEVDARARISTSLTQGVEGRIGNLSAEGCSLRLSSGLFKTGDVVWLRLDSLQPWKGTVRWTHGDDVGIEFERPFHRSVFEALARNNRPVKVAQAW